MFQATVLPIDHSKTAAAKDPAEKSHANFDDDEDETPVDKNSELKLIELREMSLVDSSVEKPHRYFLLRWRFGLKLFCVCRFFSFFQLYIQAVFKCNP